MYREVVEQMLCDYENGKFSYYGQIAKRIGWDDRARTVDRYFIEIDEFFKNHLQPPFTSILVKKEDGIPGDGYFKEHYPHIYKEAEKKTDEEKDLFLIEFWWKTLDKFDIEKAKGLADMFFRQNEM